MCTFFRSELEPEPWSPRSWGQSHRFLGVLEPEPSKCDGSTTLLIRIWIKIITSSVLDHSLQQVLTTQQAITKINNPDVDTGASQEAFVPTNESSTWHLFQSVFDPPPSLPPFSVQAGS